MGTFFYRGLSLGYFLPRDYPFKELSFGYFPLGFILGLILLGELSLGFFLSGIILRGTFFFASYKGGWGSSRGSSLRGSLDNDCLLWHTATNLTLSTHSHAMGTCALFTQCVRGLVMRGGEGRGKLDYCRQLLHCLKGWDFPTAGTGRGNLVSVELKAFLRHGDSSTKLKLIRILIDAWHEFFVFVFAAKVVLDYFKRFPINFLVVVTLKEFNLV